MAEVEERLEQEHKDFLRKMANNSKEHIEASSGDLTVKDVDKLLGLFRQLEDLLNPKLPPKNQKLWGQCLKEGQRKFDEQIKQRKAQFTARPGKSILPKKTSKIKQRQGQRLRQDRVLAIAEKSYCEKDSNYAEAINAAKKAVLEVVKEIDHTLYPVREPLLKFDRARGTLLEADFNQIRKLYKFVVKDSLQCQVGEVIDSLETIRGKIFRRQMLKKYTPHGGPDGCVPQHEYKWQKVQKKVENHWKSLKKGNHPFPSIRSIARDIKENAGTVTKAILYSRSLTQAYNKGKPPDKKVKFINPSKLDFVGLKAFRKGGSRDPVYEEEKEWLLNQIERAAHKEAKDFDPDVAAYGRMVLKHKNRLHKLPNKGLGELLKDLREKRANRMAKMKAAFEMDRLR